MRKIILAIIAIISILGADEVSNWCGYNTNLMSNLNQSDRGGFWYKYLPGKIILPVSTVNKKDIVFIKSLYSIYNYDKRKIFMEFINGYKKNTGPFNDFLKKVIPHSFNGMSYRSIAYELVYGKVIKFDITKRKKNEDQMDNFFFWWEGRSERNPRWIYFINPKFLMANLDAAKNGIEVSEGQIVKATFGDGPNYGFNPCDRQD